MRMGRRVWMKVSLDQLYSVKLSHVCETVGSRRKKVFSCFIQQNWKAPQLEYNDIYSLSPFLSPLYTAAYWALYFWVQKSTNSNCNLQFTKKLPAENICSPPVIFPPLKRKKKKKKLLANKRKKKKEKILQSRKLKLESRRALCKGNLLSLLLTESFYNSSETRLRVFSTWLRGLRKRLWISALV